MAVMVASLLACGPLIAKEKWLRIQSSGAPQTSGPDGSAFEILTDAGEATGRRALERLLLLRAALAPRGVCPLPVRVILLASEREFAGYRHDPYVKGFYQSGPGIDTIVTFAQGAGTNHVLAHEFVHLVRNHQGGWLGRWLEEGFAEYYSTIEFRKGLAIAGQNIEAHAQQLRNPDAGDEPLLYARGWAAARAVILLLRGSLEVRIRLTPIADEGAAVTTQMSDVDAMVVCAGLFLEVGNRPEAAKLFKRIAAENPNSAAAELGLFQLAMFDSSSTRNRDEAGKHILRAIELGAGADATFEYAMLLRESNAPREEIDRWLNRTLALSPLHVEAHLIAGTQATAEGKLESALAHLNSAASILPRQASVWHALGYAEYKAGRLEAARASARRALDAAKDDQDHTMARSLIALIDEPKSTRAGSAVVTPDSWKPGSVGDRRSEGTLIRVECGGNGAILHVETIDGVLRLAATAETRVAAFAGAGPAESRAGAEIPCPLPRPRRVRVEYRRDQDALILAAIEFIDP